MSLRDGLVRGRSHIVFMLGLVAAAGIIVVLERSSLLQQRLGTRPTTAEVEAAKLAWNASAGAADHAGAQHLARKLGVDTAAALGSAPPAMSAAAGDAILAALAREHGIDTLAQPENTLP